MALYSHPDEKRSLRQSRTEGRPCGDTARERQPCPHLDLDSRPGGKEMFVVQATYLCISGGRPRYSYRWCPLISRLTHYLFSESFLSGQFLILSSLFEMPEVVLFS